MSRKATALCKYRLLTRQELVFDSFGSKNGQQSVGCIHTAGSYTVKITTSDVAWCVYALQTLDKKSH